MSRFKGNSIGKTGATGASGYKGSTGATGGTSGFVGASGFKGATGSTGPKGEIGIKGPIGPTIPGGNGSTGATGTIGTLPNVAFIRYIRIPGLSSESGREIVYKTGDISNSFNTGNMNENSTIITPWGNAIWQDTTTKIYAIYTRISAVNLTNTPTSERGSSLFYIIQNGFDAARFNSVFAFAETGFPGFYPGSTGSSEYSILGGWRASIVPVTYPISSSKAGTKYGLILQVTVKHQHHYFEEKMEEPPYGMSVSLYYDSKIWSLDPTLPWY